jgi:diguanylate cyclase (GGDEF)-like protein/PAS domain S-box-containing protein
MADLKNIQFQFYSVVAAENAPEPLYFATKDRQIIFWNKKAELATGYLSNEIVGKFCFDNILDHTNEEGKNLCKDRCPLVIAVETGKPHFAQVYLKTKQGARIPVTVEVYPVKDASGKIIGAIEYFYEKIGLKAIKQKIRKLERETYIDALTGIPNRRYLEESLVRFFEEYRNNGKPFAVIFADIDGFKEINDNLGHLAGDAALRSFAETLLSNIKPGDVVARFGGDEFVILLKNINDQELRQFVQKLKKIVSVSSFRHNSQEINLNASFGASLVSPEDNPATILEKTDTMMLEEKRSKKASKI